MGELVWFLMDVLGVVCLLSLILIIGLGTISVIAILAKLVVEEWEDRYGE